MLEILLAAAAVILTVFHTVSASELLPARAMIPVGLARKMRKDT